LICEESRCHPLKGPCQEQKLFLCKKDAFLVDIEHGVTEIFSFAEISLGFGFQPWLHQSPIRIKVMSK
jgi:hypothetical protein